MKKARQIKVPSDRELTTAEYNKLLDHAYNSSLWYATNTFSNTAKIREKLYKKGYPKESVTVKGIDDTFEVNFVEESIERLIDLELLSDLEYAIAFLRKRMQSGVSLSRAKMELFPHGIDRNIAEEAALELEDDEESEAFQTAFNRLVSSSSFTSLDKQKRSQKAFRALVSKGFDFGKVSEALQEYEDLLEDDE